MRCERIALPTELYTRKIRYYNKPYFIVKSRYLAKVPRIFGSSSDKNRYPIQQTEQQAGQAELSTEVETLKVYMPLVGAGSTADLEKIVGAIN